MGSPLGPALANSFLCYHEVNWLKECPPLYAPAFYARYVDDIFVLMSSLELEKDNTLPFLDVNVYIHRKDTFSGVYTNFYSFIPTDYKRGLVSTLLHQAFMINSSY